MPRRPNYFQEYREKNRERLRKYRREHARKNPQKRDDKRKEYEAEYRKENREKTRDYAREWYEKNKAKVAEQRRRKRIEKYGPPKVRTRKSKEQEKLDGAVASSKFQQKRNLCFREMKSYLRCERCGKTGRGCLDYHHADAATKECKMGTTGKNGSRTQLVDELHKCHVLCANCHRLEHHGNTPLAYSRLDAKEIEEVAAQAADLVREMGI